MRSQSIDISITLTWRINGSRELIHRDIAHRCRRCGCVINSSICGHNRLQRIWLHKKCTRCISTPVIRLICIFYPTHLLLDSRRNVQLAITQHNAFTLRAREGQQHREGERERKVIYKYMFKNFVFQYVCKLCVLVCVCGIINRQCQTKFKLEKFQIQIQIQNRTQQHQ